MRLSRSSRVLNGVVTIVVGSAAGQAVVILAYPFLSRLYDPTDFGLLTVFMAVASMLGVLSTASLEAAIPLPTEDAEGTAVAWASLAFVALTALLTLCIGWVAGAQIASALGVPTLAEYWWLIALTVFVSGTYTVFSEWMIRKRTYAAIGRRNIVNGIGQVTTQVGLGLAGVRPIGLLLGLCVGRLLGIGGLASQGGLLREPRPSLPAIKAAISRYRRFPLVASWSRLLNNAGLEVPFLVIAAMYGSVGAGLLGLTTRAIAGPAVIIGQAVYQVFTGEVSARIRTPDGAIRPFVQRAVLRLLAVGIVPAIVLTAFGPSIFGFVFGEQWTESGHFAQILAVAFLAQFMIAPISQTLFLLERQGQQLFWDVSRLVLTAGGPVLCGLLGAPIVTAIITLSVAHVISYALLYVLSIRAVEVSDRAGQG